MKNLVNQRGRVLKAVILIILGLGMVSYCSRSAYEARVSTANTALTQAGVNAPQAIVKPEIKVWKYDQIKDEMTGEITSYAALDSKELINLKWPYSGHNQPKITIVKGKKSGYNVIYSITKGQILCRDCYVQVRFDDNPPVNFEGAESSSMKSELIFLLPAKKFVDMMKKSQTVKIQVNIYKEGNIVSVFDVAGYRDQ